MIFAAGSKLKPYEIQVLLDTGGTHKFVPLLTRSDVFLWCGTLSYFEGPNEDSIRLRQLLP
jgi:hypothetical protein